MSGKRPILGINRRNMEFVFDDPNPRRFRDLDDKIRGKERLEAAGVRVPRTLGVVDNGNDIGELHRTLEDHDDLVIKPARGSGGKGILVLAREGERWRTPGGRQLTPAQIEDHVLDVLSGSFSLDESADRAVLEERVHPHAFLSELYPRGLSDLRVVVEDGEPVQAMLRVPTDASDGRANLHGGGLGLGIDLETGLVRHAVQGRRTIERHPDTGTPVIGREVPAWTECLATSRAAAKAFSEIRYLGVDIILDDHGPMVLEMNARPGLAIQVANREGQPVKRQVVRAPFERATEVAAFAVLASLLVLPLGFGLWQDRIDTEVRAVRVERGVEIEDDEIVAGGGVEWSDDGIPISSVDDRFAEARTSAASGDTTRAFALYRSTTDNDALAPFALNNIALIHREYGQLERALDVLDAALDRFPDYARGAYNRGLILRDLGRFPEAVAAFERAIELRPGYARAWSQRGELALEAEDHETAREAFENAVRFDPDAIADRWRLGRALLELDRPGEAAERFREALALGGGTAATRDWVAARFAHADRSGSTLTEASFDSLAERLAPIALGPRVSRTVAALWGELLWRRGDVTAARRWFARSEVADGSVEAMASAVALELERGDWDGALARLAATDAPAFMRWAAAARLGAAIRTGADLRTLDLDDAPLVATARNRIALSAFDAPARGDAIGIDSSETSWLATGRADFSRSTPARLHAAQDEPALPIPSTVLAWWSVRSGHPDGGADASAFEEFLPSLRERFHDALARNELDAAHAAGMALVGHEAAATDVMVALARIELLRERPSLCRSVLESLPAVERTRPDVLRLEAELLRAESKNKAARRILEKLVASDPLDAELLAELARVQSVTGKRRSATQTWSSALQQRPDRADWTAELAKLLTDRRKYAEAVTYWDRALGLGVDGEALFSAQFNRALSLQRQDLFDRAVTGWDTVLALDPTSRAAHFNRALALQALGRRADAIAGYRDVLALDPEHAVSQRRLDELFLEGPE